jgi:hypothetical protein
MRFDIVVANRTLRGVSYDCHEIAGDACEIRGPDGELAPYVEPDMSFLCHLDAYAPLIGARRREIDLAAFYSITKEGEYTVKVRKLADDLCESNTVRFTVRGGTVFVADEVLEAVRKAIPRDWEAGRYPTVEFEKCSIPGRSETESVVVSIRKGGRTENRIDLYLSKTAAPEREVLRPRELRSVFLGKDHRGCFYAAVFKGTDESWLVWEGVLRKALGLKEG